MKRLGYNPTSSPELPTNLCPVTTLVTSVRALPPPHPSLIVTRYGKTGLEGNDEGKSICKALQGAIDRGVLRKIKMRKMRPFKVFPEISPGNGFNSEVRSSAQTLTPTKCIVRTSFAITHLAHF